MKGIGIGIACAVMVACAGGMKSQSARPAPVSDAGAMAPMPGDSPQHLEIAKLDSDIVKELAQHGLQPAPEAMCGASCDMNAIAMDSKPVADDPRLQACKPSPSDTCNDSCTLSSSICKNADRICTIAHELGDHDAYANDKCVRGSQSCQASKLRCCSCM